MDKLGERSPGEKERERERIRREREEERREKERKTHDTLVEKGKGTYIKDSFILKN